MKDSELQFDRNCHVLYSKPCKKEILAKIALHYPEARREAVWEQVQRQYAAFLSDWRTDLGGAKNFHNGAGGTYDCIAILSYYVVCKAVTSFREIEEMEEALILPSFRRLKFVDCNKPFFRRLLHWAFTSAKARCDEWHDYHGRPMQRGLCVHGADPRQTDPHDHLRKRVQMRLHHLRRPGPLPQGPPRIPG